MLWDLIIFDCDGVLVDSEPVSGKVFYNTLLSEGIVIPEDKIASLFTGYSMNSCMKIVKKETGISVSGDFLRKYTASLYEEFRKNLTPIPHVIQSIDSIPYPVCVASSGSLERIGVSLSVTGLQEKFSGRIFSAEQVKSGKPCPDLFLYAAECCNANPEKCAVIEDSIPGIEAGIAANMHVFGFIKNGISPFIENVYKYSDIISIFHDMHELPELLSKYPD